MTDVVPDEEFRAVGFTGKAREFPLSDTACGVISELNGIPVEKMPRAWRYAPNPYMRDWMEWLGKEKTAGRSIWNDDRSRVRLP